VRYDRIAEDIYIVISSLYVQVTATVLFTDEGAIVIDTLPFPSETRELRKFVESTVGPGRVRYVVLSHHHADHVYGAYQFAEAEIVAQDLCRDLLATLGRQQLARARRDTPALAEVSLRLPDITYRDQMHLHIGHRHLQLFSTPGHSPDGTSVWVDGVKAVIASDVMMPVPTITEGNREALRASLRRIDEMDPSFLVQGHGDVLLRGEVEERIAANLSYIEAIEQRVADLVARGDPPSALRDIDIEDCGISRIPLDGLVSRLHLNNLVAIYKEITQSDRDQ